MIGPMSLRDTSALIGLAALGGTWAVAWGNRRVQRPQRTAMLDARLNVQVRLDALRARTAELGRHELTEDARRLVDEAVEDQVLIDAVLSRAASVDDVRDLDPQIESALMAIEEAADYVGLAMPAHDPFAGLCTIDPTHGLGGTAGDSRGLCVDCAEAARAGNAPSRRQVTRDGQPVPFDAAG